MAELFGFEKLEKSLLNNFKNNQLHHGLLLSGNKGIGKASFALELATKILLSSSTNPHEDLKKIQSQSHPDLLIIKKDEKKRDIAVDEVREINQFLNFTAAIAKHRVIIIDAIDDMNKSSSNALLKILEEPNNNVFLLLVSHNPKRLLATIKSRCYLIKISNPSYEEFKQSLIKKGVAENSIQFLADISESSIGGALELSSKNSLELYDKIIAATNDRSLVFNLAKTLAKDSGKDGGDKDRMWEIFKKLIMFYLYSLIKSNPNNPAIFVIVDKVNNLFTNTTRLNLDKNHSIINIFNIMQDVRN